jgi:hypothetical protein
MKLLADVDTLLLLISCHKFEHKFGGNMTHDQFSNQNQLVCPITNSSAIGKVSNDSMLIFTNKLLMFGYSVGHCVANGPTHVLGVLNVCPTRPELSMPFKHLCTAHAFILERLSNHCQGLHRTTSEICSKFDAVCLSNPSRNRVRPDMKLQIKQCKNQHIHPAA